MPVTLFYSYAHEDEGLRDELQGDGDRRTEWRTIGIALEGRTQVEVSPRSRSPWITTTMRTRPRVQDAVRCI
jgi:hypothetical protein